MMTGRDPRQGTPAEAVKYQILVMFLIAGGTGLGRGNGGARGVTDLTDGRHRLPPRSFASAEAGMAECRLTHLNDAATGSPGGQTRQPMARPGGSPLSSSRPNSLRPAQVHGGGRPAGRSSDRQTVSRPTVCRCRRGTARCITPKTECRWPGLQRPRCSGAGQQPPEVATNRSSDADSRRSLHESAD